MILFGKRVIQQHFYVPYPSCCSVDDGVSEGQFVDVSRVSSSNDSGDRNTSAHHSLHHVQISLIQPCVMQSGKKIFVGGDTCRHLVSKLSLTLVSQTESPELIFPVRVDTCVIQNHVWTESLQQPGEVSLHCGSSDMLAS